MGTASSRRGMLGIAALAVSSLPTIINSSASSSHQSLPLVETIAAKPRNPDAWLIRLCTEWPKVEDEIEAIWSPFYDTPGDPGEVEQARNDDLCKLKWRLEDRIARTRARTAEGRQAKARVLLGMVGSRDKYDEPPEIMARSLAMDMFPQPAPGSRAAGDEALLLSIFRDADVRQQAVIFRALIDMKAGVPHDVIEARLRIAFPQGLSA